jgi:hypothetical protein
MKVNTISVNIRYSRQMPDGSHKTIELSAEGTMDPDEDRHKAQVTLYHELGKTMKYVFSGNGSGKAQIGPEKPVEPPPAPQKAYWCSTHNKAFQRYEKGGHVWYTHRSVDGWCRES